MRIGLFYQIQVPKPWTAESEAQRIYEALEQIPYAEAQGLVAQSNVQDHRTGAGEAHEPTTAAA